MQKVWWRIVLWTLVIDGLFSRKLNIYLGLVCTCLFWTIQGPCHSFQLLCTVLACLNMGLHHTLGYTL